MWRLDEGDELTASGVWECGGMEDVWGRYGSCRGGPFHELYSRTNQRAIRQTLSKNVFAPMTPLERTSVSVARTNVPARVR